MTARIIGPQAAFGSPSTPRTLGHELYDLVRYVMDLAADPSFPKSRMRSVFADAITVMEQCDRDTVATQMPTLLAQILDYWHLDVSAQMEGPTAYGVLAALRLEGLRDTLRYAHNILGAYADQRPATPVKVAWFVRNTPKEDARRPGKWDAILDCSHPMLGLTAYDREAAWDMFHLSGVVPAAGLSVVEANWYSEGGALLRDVDLRRLTVVEQARFSRGRPLWRDAWEEPTLAAGPHTMAGEA